MEFKDLQELINETSVYTIMEEEVPNDFPKFEVIEKTSGYDDGDESLEAVLHFIDDNIYVKVSGYYQSYGAGTTWNNYLTQVYPQKKTITIFTTSK